MSYTFFQLFPLQRSLERRFWFILAPLALLAFLLLGALAWWSAGRTAEQLISDEISNNLEIAADSVPLFLETGQNLILRLAANTRLADPSPELAVDLLQPYLNEFPYFDQLTLVDTGGNTIAGVPVGDFLSLKPDANELNAISLAIQGISFQLVSVRSPDLENTSAELIFVAAVRNSNNQVRSVLIGSTILSENPFAQAIVKALQNIDEIGGQGYLADGSGQFVMAPLAAALLQPYSGRSAAVPLLYKDKGPDGTRQQIRYQPVSGSSWCAVASWPSGLSRRLAFITVWPILGLLLFLALIFFSFLRISLRSVTSSLRGLAAQAHRIARGDLEAPLSIQGNDEVGDLAVAVETMRQTLSKRVEETQRLLAVSQGLSSSLEVRSHIEPILDAALAGGASVARLVFAGENRGRAIGFGKGQGNEKYEAMDAQILELTMTQPRVLLNNPARARLKIEKGTPFPESLAAFALLDQKNQLGALWLVYDKPQTFEPDAVRYLETLASQAAGAAANARIYVSAKLDQQRLESLLMENPDALLVTDLKQNLVFFNQAAARILDLEKAVLPAPLQRVMNNNQLQALFTSAGSKQQQGEIQSNGRTYSTQISPIWAGGELIGFAGKLRDVTQSKQNDVAQKVLLRTVGHDLNDPLELMKGYLAMLSMVGKLNDEQNVYVQKIEQHIEGISRLAGNLLTADRLQTGEGLQLQTFLIGDLLPEVIKEIEPRARQKKIELAFQPPRSKDPLEADRVLLHRAFYSLLDNAVKYSPRGGVVKIMCDFEKEYLRVAIKDAGPGISRMDLIHLFDPSEKATGLTIVRFIAERHGGRVWAESELGKGSTFFLQVPVRQTT